MFTDTAAMRVWYSNFVETAPDRKAHPARWEEWKKRADAYTLPKRAVEVSR